MAEEEEKVTGEEEEGEEYEEDKQLDKHFLWDTFGGSVTNTAQVELKSAGVEAPASESSTPFPSISYFSKSSLAPVDLRSSYALGLFSNAFL